MVLTCSAQSLVDSSFKYEHVIITSKALANATADYTLKDLRDHRIAHGMSSTIITVEAITAAYPGRDDAEKVRNFIIDAYRNGGTRYVLLGGDTNHVPFRLMHTRGKKIASDLYFGCLDGDFDANANNLFGEGPDDKCDYTYEVAVGRFSAENKAEMANAVYKTITAENTPRNASFLTKLINVNQKAAGVGDTAAWPRVFKRGSRELSIGFYHDTPYNKNDFLLRRMNSHNIGQFIWASHGEPHKLGNGIGFDAAKGLTNGDQFFFIHTIACLSGKFQTDCIAEHLATETRSGGMFAGIFNSVTSEATSSGIARYIHEAFPKVYYEDGITRLGDVRAALQYIHADIYKTDELAHHTTFHHNLFGDPAALWKQLYAVSLANHWPLDNGRGSSADDASGNGNTLTLAKGCKWIADGVHGAAIAFNGSDAAVAGSLNQWAPLNNFGEITLAAWIRPDHPGGNLVWKGDAASSVFRLAIDQSGKLNFFVNEGTPENQRGGEQHWASSATLNPGTWQHVAVCFQKSPLKKGARHGDTGTLTFHINGQTDSEYPVDTLYFGANNAPLMLGSGFAGALDDVRIYGRPLSASELQRAMKNDRIEIPEKEPAAIERRLSISAWINPIAYSTEVCSKGSPDALPFKLSLAASGKLRLEANRGDLPYASNSGTYESSSTIPLNQSTHIAVTYNGEAIQFFINGKLNSSTETYLRFGDSPEPIRVGNHLRDLTIFNRDLTPLEIARLSLP